MHGFNYSDLPLWDMVFGTFRNPRYFADEVGFYKGASAKVAAMWTFQDVSKPENEDETPTRRIPTTSVLEKQRAA